MRAARGRPLGTYVVRGITGAPRRAAILVGLTALCSGVVLVQVHAAAGVQRSVTGAFLGIDQRTVVVAAVQPRADPVTVTSLERFSSAARRLPGVVAAGAAVDFTAPLAGANHASPAVVAWAEPAYQRLVAEPGDPVRAVTDGSAALVPQAVAAALGLHQGQPFSVGPDTVTDVGPGPESFKDPSLRSAVIVAAGVGGPAGSLRGATVELAVLSSSAPSARLVADLRLVIGADDPTQAVVVSQGAPDVAASHVESLTGAAGRAGVLVAALAGMAIVLILQSNAVHRRRAEIAVRRSLGASRALVGAVIGVEAVLLGAVGGVVGAAASGVVLLDLVAANVIAPVPVGLGEVAVAALAAGCLTGLAAVVPAVRAARTDPADVLRSLGEG